MKQETREKLVWMASVIHTALVTDDEGITKQILGYVKEEIEKMYGTTARGGAVATEPVSSEPEKKRTNLEFCGLKLNRYSCKDGTMYIGTRDFRPSGDKQLWSVDVILDSTGGHTGAVRKNGHLIAKVNDTTLSKNKLERFLVGGLHAVLKRKEYENRKGRELKKAKKAAKRVSAQ